MLTLLDRLSSPYLTPVYMGVQSFAITLIFDKTVKALFARDVQASDISLQDAFVSPIVEEMMYSGILLTSSAAWMIPRFFVSLITGMTAARALTGRVTAEQNQEGLTLDTKIGVLFAVFREALACSLPVSTRSVVLVISDSCVFALSEVCPKEGVPDTPRFSSAWSYKVISSAFFRLTANTVAKAYGIAASITQHLSFNLTGFFTKDCAAF